MRKKVWIIVLLTLALFLLSAVGAYYAYPRMMWWLGQAINNGVVPPASNEESFAHSLYSILSIAMVSLPIGLGSFIISKKRNLKETLFGWFVLVDLAFLSMIGWLVFLKYRLMQMHSITQVDLGKEGGGLSLTFADLPLYQLGIAASVVVLLIAFIYPKGMTE